MRTAIILLLGLLIAIYGFAFKFNNRRINKYIMAIHLISFGLTIIAVILSLWNWGFRGAYTERFIASLWFGSGISLYGLHYKMKIPRFIKFYFGFYFWPIIILLIAWFIPRLHFAAVVFGLGIIIDGDFHRYPIDNTYQIQTKVQGMLSGAPIIGLVENKFFLFEKVTDDFIARLENYEKIESKRISADSVKIILTPANPEYSKVVDTTIYLPGK